MVRCASRFVGQAVFFDAGKPQGAGYAGGAAERVALIQGVESKQSGQGIAGDAAPKRSCAEGLLCFGDDAGNEQPQISIGTAMEGIALRDVPGDHIAVPVQIADGHQCELWVVGSPSGRIYLLTFARESVEIDSGCSCFSAWKNIYALFGYCKGTHPKSPIFHVYQICSVIYCTVLKLRIQDCDTFAVIYFSIQSARPAYWTVVFLYCNMKNHLAYIQMTEYNIW